MKIIIGKDPNTDFKIIGESGADITDELLIKRIRIDASGTEPTTITLEAYGECEIEAKNVRMLLDEGKTKP